MLASTLQDETASAVSVDPSRSEAGGLMGVQPRLRRLPGRIAVFYLAAALAWIGATDKLAGALISDPDLLIRVSVAKGFASVGATSLVLYLLLRRATRVIENALNAVQRKEAERHLHEEGRLQAEVIIESTDVAIISHTLDGTITSWNPAAERLFGYAAGEMVGGNIERLWPPGGGADSAQILRSIEESGRPVQFETVRVRKDGGLVPVAITASPLWKSERGHGPQGKRLVGASKIVRDLTGYRRLEEQLRQAQKMEAIGRLAGGVAHDFNNLLSVILSYTGLVQDKLPPADPAREHLQEVLRAGERAADLTRQLLAFSRQQVLHPQTVDLRQLLTEAEKMLRRVLGEDIELKLETGSAQARVRADPTQLHQIVMNLALNARDAMPRGGRLELRLETVEIDAPTASGAPPLPPGAYILLEVKDTGVGMDAATRERIFEPFFTTKDKGKGTGLGLATVFGIVKQSQGHIEVFSEPGRGSTFHLFLPSTDRPLEVAKPARPAPVTLEGSETVLLVEDEDQVREMTCDLLRKSGYSVLTATNGEEALGVSRAYPGHIDLLVTDVVMPRMGGPELARKLARKRPGMRVLFISGYAESTLTPHGVMDSAIAFLPKPLTPDALLRKVREVLTAP